MWWPMTGRSTGDVCGLIILSLAGGEGTVLGGDVEEGRLLGQLRRAHPATDLAVGLG